MKMLRVLGALLIGLTMIVAAVPAGAATVKVKVNGQAITDVQISQRLALHKLEGKSSSKAATDELINEALQMQEAERLGFKVTEDEIDSAVLDVARQIKVSATNLTTILTNNGVPVSTLRDRLAANIAWSKVTASAVSASRGISSHTSSGAWA